MTREKLYEIVHSFTEGMPEYAGAIMTAVDLYTEASNGAKPPVSGSLPLDDLLHFAEYCGEHFVKMHGGWMPRFADQRNIANLLTTEQVYARWRQ